MNFPCTSCGSCCRRAYLVDIFPQEWVSEDGSCIHLKDNQCSIYETRPDYCRVGYNLVKSGLTKEEYFKRTALLCNYFMEQDEIVDKFIPLTIFQTE